MLDRDVAEMLIDRQLAATHWIETAPPADGDLSEWRAFRARLRAIRARGAWHEALSVPAPTRKPPRG